MRFLRWAAAAAALALPAAWAQTGDPAYGLVGTVKPRSSSELAAAGLTSPFGIGGETTDRGYSTYANWASYLGPLGAKKVRIQSGWHQIESTITTPATYDFSRLDAIVNGARSQGVEPWIFLGYGNENAGCTNCGTRGLGGALPSGAGKDRFINFVKATVSRYNSPTVKVTDWEIWNEPDGHVDATEYAQLAVDTAKAIKSIQPAAKVTIGSFTVGIFGSANRPYAQTVVDYFAANKGPTVPDADVYVGYHPYWQNPDYDGTNWENDFFNAFQAIVTGKNFKLRQGENGAPSTNCSSFALCGLDWNEDSQAMYLLRRMAGDFWRGIQTNIFTITDLHYDGTKNTKGLLETGTWNASVDSPYLNGDQTVKRKKKGYSAYQNVTSIFDSRLQKVSNHGCTAPAGYTVHAYTRNDAGIVRNMLVVWKRTTTLPVASAATTPITVSCTNFHFPRMAGAGLQPRYADLLGGKVYATNGVVTANNAGANDVSIANLYVGDWPAVIADQGIVLFQ